MSPEALNSLFSLCIGFAFAGALASGYQAMAERPAGFALLGEGVQPKTFAAVPRKECVPTGRWMSETHVYLRLDLVL